MATLRCAIERKARGGLRSCLFPRSLDGDVALCVFLLFSFFSLLRAHADVCMYGHVYICHQGVSFFFFQPPLACSDDFFRHTHTRTHVGRGAVDAFFFFASCTRCKKKKKKQVAPITATV
jgi:hypothetical protein